MNESWKEKRDRLCKLIKEVSDCYGGDEIEWLKDYCREIILSYKNELDIPLATFEDLLKNKKGCL